MRLYLTCALIIFLAHMPAKAAPKVQESLDLFGDGRMTTVTLPFTYWHRKADDAMSFVYQGGYRVYQVGETSKQVAVTGPLCPCIGIAVTDGQKMVLFHKDWSNSLASMGAAVREHLDMAKLEQLHAGIFTVQVLDSNKWQETDWNKVHNGGSHKDEVLRVKNYLDKELHVPRGQIQALMSAHEKIYKRTAEQCPLGRYQSAESYIALSLNNLFEKSDVEGAPRRIKFFSIDPLEAEVIPLKGTKLSTREYFRDQWENFIKEDPTIAHQECLYDEMPRNFSPTEVWRAYFYYEGMERKIYEKYYRTHWAKLQAKNPSFKEEFDKVEFYPVT